MKGASTIQITLNHKRTFTMKLQTKSRCYSLQLLTATAPTKLIVGNQTLVKEINQQKIKMYQYTQEDDSLKPLKWRKKTTQSHYKNVPILIQIWIRIFYFISKCIWK